MGPRHAPRRRTVWLGVALVVCAIAAVLVLAPHEASHPRVVLIGLDGADWGIIHPLMEEGVMPAMKSLVEGGVSAPLRTLTPTLSPIIWTTIATGRDPADHGIGWFMCDTSKGERIPVTSAARKTKALWNILSERGLTSSVLGWWATYPAEQIAGEIVSDYFAFHNFGVTGADLPTDLGRVWPPELLEQVEPLLIERQSLSYAQAEPLLHVTAEEWQEVTSKPLSFENPTSHFSYILATALGYERIASELLSRQRDLTAIYFEGIDSVSHLFMKFAPPKMESVSEEGYARYKDVVRQFYIEQDRILGRLLQKVDESSVVIVVSDHGFRHGKDRLAESDTISVPTAHLWHSKYGIFAMKGPGVRAGVTLPELAVFDITPTVLYLLGLPVADDMPGRIAIDAFESDSLKEAARISSYETEAEAKSAPHPAEALGPKTSVGDLVNERLKALGYVGSSDQSSPEIHLTVARKLMEKREWAKAEKELLDAIRQRPDQAEFHQALARAQLAQQKITAAAKSLDRALALAPGSFALLCSRAQVALLVDQPQQAVTWFAKAQKIAPQRILPLVGLGDAWNRAGHPEKAVEFLEKALEINADAPVARYDLAVVYDLLGKKEKAIACYKTLLTTHPDHGLALTNLGSLECEQGHYREAIDAFEKAREGGPETFELLFDLGTAYLQIGRLDDAVASLEGARALNPTSVDLLQNLGLAHQRNGEVRQAFETYRTLTRLDPSNDDAWLETGLIAAASDQPKGAIPFLLKARDLDRERFDEAMKANPKAAALLGEDKAGTKAARKEH